MYHDITSSSYLYISSYHFVLVAYIDLGPWGRCAPSSSSPLLHLSQVVPHLTNNQVSVNCPFKYVFCYVHSEKEAYTGLLKEGRVEKLYFIHKL